MTDKPVNFAEMLLAKRQPPGGTPPGAAEEPPDPPPGEADDRGDNQAALNASRRQQRLRLNFIFQDGRELSLAYAYLISISLDGPSLVLEFTGSTVTLKGRNLRKLKRRLDLHVQGSIREIAEFVDKAEGEPGAVAVYSISRAEPSVG